MPKTRFVELQSQRPDFESPLENSGKTILRMPSAESFLAFDRIRICTLVFDECGPPLALEFRTVVQRVRLARKCRRHIPVSLVTRMLVSLLRRRHLLRSIKGIQPLLRRRCRGSRIAGRGLGILKNEMLLSLKQISQLDIFNNDTRRNHSYRINNPRRRPLRVGRTPVLRPWGKEVYFQLRLLLLATGRRQDNPRSGSHHHQALALLGGTSSKKAGKLLCRFVVVSVS